MILLTLRRHIWHVGGFRPNIAFSSSNSDSDQADICQRSRTLPINIHYQPLAKYLYKASSYLLSWMHLKENVAVFKTVFVYLGIHIYRYATCKCWIKHTNLQVSTHSNNVYICVGIFTWVFFVVVFMIPCFANRIRVVESIMFVVSECYSLMW